MEFKKTRSLFIFIPALLAAGGCASQSALETLQQDVDSLSVQVEQAKTDSAEALRLSRDMQQSLDAVKQSADSARDDASATRTLLEQMNARMDKQANSQSLK